MTGIQGVVPTLGRSPWLLKCLESARREGGEALDLLVVHQQGAGALPEAARKLASRVLELPGPAGFAAAANRGIAAGSAPWILLLNDDAILEAGWLASLLPHLDPEGSVAALQGVNLMVADSSLADGCGVAWNRWWQAVQRGHGEPPPAPEAAPQEIFGASATAVLLRRRALEETRPLSPGPAGSPGGPFDERLETYYEDVELAVRLRRGGWGALLVPAARARHAGGASAPRQRLALLYGNRYLVVATLLGASFWRRLPVLWLRDLLDLARHPGRAPGILGGWARAVRHLRRYAHGGAPQPDPATLRRSGRSRPAEGVSEG